MQAKVMGGTYDPEEGTYCYEIHFEDDPELLIGTEIEVMDLHRVPKD